MAGFRFKKIVGPFGLTPSQTIINCQITDINKRLKISLMEFVCGGWTRNITTLIEHHLVE